MSDIALTVSVLALVAVVGLWIGNIKIRGVGVGIGGVLFGGIFVGHFADKLGLLWWIALERVIAATDRIALEVDGKSRFFDCANPGAKQSAYVQMYWWLRELDDERELRRIVTDLHRWSHHV